MMYRRPHSFLTIGILLLGFSTIVTQTVLLREFLTVFSGNELVIGIVLASWMILTGTGAYLGQFAKERFFGSNWILIVLTLMSVLPIVILLVLQFLRNLGKECPRTASFAYVDTMLSHLDFVRRGDAPQRSENRDFKLQRGEFALLNRRKPVVLGPRRNRHLLDHPVQRFGGIEPPDAATQLTTLLQCNERPTWRAECRGQSP